MSIFELTYIIEYITIIKYVSIFESIPTFESISIFELIDWLQDKVLTVKLVSCEVKDYKAKGSNNLFIRYRKCLNLEHLEDTNASNLSSCADFEYCTLDEHQADR